MALQVVSPKVSVYKVLGVKDGQEQTEEHVFSRGETLPDWVSSYQQFILTTSGMAVQVGDFPDPALEASLTQPAPVLMPEHDPRTVIGTPVTEPMAVTTRVTDQGGGEAGGTDSGGDVEAPPDLPGKDANKPEWEDTAVQLGLPRAKAESMRKADLVDEVTKRHRAATRKAAKPQEPPASGDSGDDGDTTTVPVQSQVVLPPSYAPQKTDKPGGS